MLVDSGPSRARDRDELAGFISKFSSPPFEVCLGGKLINIVVCIMACKGTGEEVKLLNLAGAYAPSPKAQPTHFTVSRCLLYLTSACTFHLSSDTENPRRMW